MSAFALKPEVAQNGLNSTSIPVLSSRRHFDADPWAEGLESSAADKPAL